MLMKISIGFSFIIKNGIKKIMYFVIA